MEIPTSQRPHAGGREDCWSEGATETLIESWGARYLCLKRGNLRQKDWKEVAEAVNSRDNGVKPRRTDVQCKNRIDTLKKKYKLEKAKPSPSKWPFYNRLDYLLCTSILTPALDKKSSRTLAVSVKSESIAYPNSNGLLFSADDEVACGMARQKSVVELLEEETMAYKELATAILRFGEIYERIENAKQEQMMELEKQRMQFTKDLEFQRMNMFVETQLRLEKMTHPAKILSSSVCRSSPAASPINFSISVCSVVLTLNKFFS